MSSRPYSRLAGDSALDLVNTVSWRLDPHRRADRLVDFEESVRCLQQLDLLNAAEADAVRSLARASPARAEDELARLVSLREALYAVIVGEPGGDEEITRQHAEWAAAAALVATDEGVTWALPLDLALPRRRAAKRTVDLLLREKPGDLRRCDDDACGWVFLDGSPRRNRRWCDSADCGNRNRVRAHYERTRTSRQAASA